MLFIIQQNKPVSNGAECQKKAQRYAVLSVLICIVVN